MAAVISITQQKGGAGKTSLVVHLGAAWAAQGRRVTLIDTDPQQSLTAWHAMRSEAQPDAFELPLVTAEGWKLPMELSRARKTSDIVLVDTPPHAETAARLAVRESDLVLLPVQPTPLDAWATRETLALIAKEKKPYRLIFNRVPPRSRVAEAVQAEFTEEGLDIAGTRLGNRQIYAESFITGRGVTEMPGHTPAHEEIAALIAELDI